MKYYRVKSRYDNCEVVRANRYIRTLFENELLTTKEYQDLLPAHSYVVDFKNGHIYLDFERVFEEVTISSKHTYKSFGIRFEIKN